MDEKKTGYASIDKPWRKYYAKEEMEVAVPEGTMFDYLYYSNSSNKNDIAIEYYGHKYTYQELFDLIDRCCRNLTALGIKKGSVVTVQAISLPQVVVLLYALTRIGACGNMIYPDAKAKEVIASMKKTHSQLLVVVDKILSTYEEELPDSFSKRVLVLNIADQMSFIPRMIAIRKAAYRRKNLKLHTVMWREFINGEGQTYQENHDAEVPAVMLRTGGTTGIPKEVVLNSKCFNTIAEATLHSQLCSKWERQKTSLLLLPPFIAFGIGSGIHHPLVFGTKLIIALNVSPAAVSKLFRKYRPNYVTAGTVQIEQFVRDWEKRKKTLNYLDLLAIGGEAMNETFEEKLQSFLKAHHSNIKPTKGYGLTETAGSVIAETLLAKKNGSVGIPLPLNNMKIVDPNTGAELKYNELGEICLSGPSIMQEYYGKKEATEEIIEVIDGQKWLHSGDIGYISEDGLLTITGRIKRIIICREGTVFHKVFPLLIEDQLSTVPGVREISIVGRPDAITGNVLVAYVVPTVHEEIEKVICSLKEFCSCNLDSYERPMEYYSLNELPRTLIGKVDYRALEKRAEQESSRFIEM